ncbi:hypothetical protein F5B22DRAFT_295651 [Xylaria bambusicola]|uniref:uncharacterized protein n=1 Tax=Xylaria bambusicola TaxID=326684 RepID=UPI0020073949|nr:uncharacterized protein F5B22DRAFT_295651 [Xylaria bambusicola]KAI0512818.1 hypothetical protein F5B22DRAFT_295651 [Xylaria bambusicola]
MLATTSTKRRQAVPPNEPGRHPSCRRSSTVPQIRLVPLPRRCRKPTYTRYVPVSLAVRMHDTYGGILLQAVFSLGSSSTNPDERHCAVAATPIHLGRQVSVQPNRLDFGNCHGTEATVSSRPSRSLAGSQVGDVNALFNSRFGRVPRGGGLAG